VPRLLGPAYHCSHPLATAPFNIDQAFANSCNYFFSEVGARTSAASLAYWYSTFGFGVAGEAASPGEVNIPDNAKGRALAAIGEQGVTATPAQVLLAYSAIAEHGNVFSLILPTQHRAPSLDRVISLKPSTYALLTQAMRDCVTSGTCRAAGVPGIKVAGKTGTAPTSDGSRVTHAWFVGFAPADVPEVALVIFLQRGTGSVNAAPLAAQIFKQYFDEKHPAP
jgi:cell division protein FtsI/penicillin-binding protein 2